MAFMGRSLFSPLEKGCKCGAQWWKHEGKWWENVYVVPRVIFLGVNACNKNIVFLCNFFLRGVV